MMAHIYVPMILYYPNSEQNSPTTISNQLKNSLSQTLSKYYPFAGRLRSGSYVDCNDKGVPFVEAQIGCQLSNVLERAPDKSQDGILTHLFPPYTTWDSVPDQAPNLMVQLNHFACGGIAVTASLFHRLADASSVCSFLRYWATLSRHSGDFNKLSYLHPHFRLHQPPVEESHVADDDDFNDSVDDDNDSSTKAANSFHAKPYMCKEIVFHNTSIEKLRDTLEIQNKLQGVVTGQRYTRNVQPLPGPSSMFFRESCFLQKGKS